MTPATRRARARRGEGELLRNDILAAAEQLLIQTGDDDAVSIRAIADAAGVTPPSIYLHFADKSELLAAVCEARFRDFDQYLQDATAGIDDPVEALGARGRAAGVLAQGDPFLVATGLWTAVHGVTSLLIARPDFPWPDRDRLLDH